MPGRAPEPILEVQGLTVDIASEAGSFPVVRSLDLALFPGETLGLVGESGSGKTLTCLSLTRLLPSPPARYQSGRVLFQGNDLWQMDEPALTRIRGRHIAMIFQEAQSALNPVLTAGEQVREVLSRHFGLPEAEGRRRVLALFSQVGISDPERRYHQYPHQLSGGLQQRVMIAMALAGEPEVLIADEPTTALDVTIQAQILELIQQIQRQRQMSVLFVTHDLGVVAELCNRVLVLYAGREVESGPVEQIFREPRHPYTRMLLDTVPDLSKPRGRFQPIPGQVPSPAYLPGGCAFHPRCPEADDTCRRLEPPIETLSPGRRVSCWRRMEDRTLAPAAGRTES
ncbi:MAG: ABC transporter ATP-binding protein [Calditrichaeota bacterium]|nr:MAG: ABC transporter ATP-binding protein [Calditrichota bacterium]